MRNTCIVSSTVVAEKSTLESSVLPHHPHSSIPEKGLRRHSPKERPKSHTSLQRPAYMVIPTIGHANEHCQRDEAGEPENRCHSIHSQDRELVADVPGLSIVAWGEYEEGNGEDGPDGAEDQEVDLAGGCVAV